MTIECDIRDWRERRWPKPGDQNTWDVFNTWDVLNIWDALKVCEEAGELAGALVKWQEGRATRDDILEEMGDVLIALSVIAARLDCTLEQLRADRWVDVEWR